MALFGNFPKPHDTDTQQIMVGLGLLFAFGLLSVLAFPSLDRVMGATQPTLLSIIGPGASISILTLGVLFWMAQGKLSYTRRLMISLGFFAVLMAFVKFLLSPSILFVAQAQFHFEGQFADMWSNPGNVMLAIIMGVFAMYLAVFMILRSGFAKKLGITNAQIKTPKVKKATNAAARVWGLLILVGFAVFTGGAVLLIPVAILVIGLGSIDPVFQYLSLVFGGAAGVVAALCLASAAGALAIAFDEASRVAVVRRNVGVFVTVAWIALGLLVVYHVLWAVYMFVLVTFWPFKVTTVVPK